MSSSPSWNARACRASAKTGYNPGNAPAVLIFCFTFLNEPKIEPNKKVLFIPGNWDTTKEHERLKLHAKSIHNYYVTYDDVSIAGIGSPDMKFSFNEEDFQQIKKQFDRMESTKKILVSHLHARGTKAEFSGVRGDEILRRAVLEFSPDVLICSHIHEGEGIEDKIGKTQIFQVGRKGKIFDI